VVQLRVSDGHLTITLLGLTLAEHAIVVPGETSILDDHYGGPRAKPRRALRPRTPDEVVFCAYGPVAEAFIKGAAATGSTSLKRDLSVLVLLERAHGRDAVLRALERAVEFGRYRAYDVESILYAGEGVARHTKAGNALVTELPRRATSLAQRLQGGGDLVSASAPPLALDLDAALRRLRLSAIRHLAPELLVTSKTQRWSPEEFLRTLLEAEITSRDASNARARLKLADFPVTKTLEEFDVSQSSIPRATFDYLCSLEWIRAAENLCLVGPAGHRQESSVGRSRPRGGGGRFQGALLQRALTHRDPL
jgi:hypothetical protein